MDKNRTSIKPIVNYNTTVVIKAIALSALILGSIIAVAGTTIPGLFGGNNAAWAGTFPGNNGKIAFVSTRDANNAEIYVMNADGTAPTRLTTDPTATPFVDEQPSWSADGSKIAFRSTRGGGGIYVMNADGTGITRIADGREPSLSPDGSKIAFTSADNDIYLMNADGTGVKQLTTDPAQDTKPSWSPDGSKIAFTSGRVDDDTTTDTDIYVMNAADGSGVIRLTNDPVNNLGANDVASSWSPDGSRIAFQSNRGFIPPEIYSMKADGTDLQRLTNNGILDVEPSWSPDGSKIAFQTNRDGNLEIYSIKAADGTDITRLTNNAASDTEPDWGTHISDTTPPTVVNTDPANEGTNVLVSTDVRATFSEPMDGTTITPTTFTVAIDGTGSGPISATVSYNPTDNTAKLHPSSPLAYSTTYKATVTQGVKDAAGNSMAADYSWKFTTGAAPNQPPTANAGSDQTVNEGDSVTLDGSASSDPDGTIVSYAWKQIAGPAVTLSDPKAQKPTFTAPDVDSAGATLTFGLTVTDNGGATSTQADTVNINVNNVVVNQPPTANAGSDQTVSEGQAVQLDGSGSKDPEGDTLTYAWTQTAGPSVTLSDASSAAPTFTAPNVGPDGDTLTFKLAVDDGNGHTASDTVDIGVQNVNQAPKANAGADQTVNEGTKVLLDGSASSDPDGDTLTYAWTQIAGTAATLNGATTATPSFTAPDVGSAGDILTFELTVNDGNGHTASDTVDIVVKDVPPPPDTTPPETTIVSAIDGNNKDVPKGGTTTSSVIAFKFSSPDSDVAKFQCSLDGAKLIDCTSPQSYKNLALGPHTFGVIAIDKAGNADKSPATWSWSVKHDTSLTLTKTGKETKTSYGVTGTLLDVSDKSPLAGKTITIKTFDSSGTEVKELRKTVTTAKDGTYLTTMTKPTKAGAYTVQSFFDGTSEYNKSKSTSISLSIK
jgi:Tol biopolymer transport system component